MLYCNRIDVSEGIDVDKTNESSKCIILNYFYFRKVNFRFQPKVCDGCHDLMQKVMSFNDVAILYIKRNDYGIHFGYLSKEEAINIMNNSDLKEKS